MSYVGRYIEFIRKNVVYLAFNNILMSIYADVVYYDGMWVGLSVFYSCSLSLS